MTEKTWRRTDEIEHEFGRGDPFAAAVRSTRMPMVISDPRKEDNPIVYANDAFLELVGYPRDEVMGRNCRFLQGEGTDPDDIRRLGQAIARKESIKIDLLNYRKDGTSFWNALYVGPVHAEDGELQFHFASQVDVTDRVEAQQAASMENARIEALVAARTKDLEAALAEKSILLDEVDHRVKNNLSMVGSLLRMQARKVDDPAMVRSFDTMLSRIDALSSVHRTLHDTADVRQFDASRFLKDLVETVSGLSGRDDVSINLTIDPLLIAAEQGTAFGLLMNELLTNVFKHAFNGRKGGRLDVGLTQEGDDIVATISDDGPGHDGTTVSGTTLGQSLIRRLSKQLGGATEWPVGTGGSTSVTRFPSQ